ncbi:MAG: hypothetical protein AAF564_01375 [Bacteroidota bacterium]
MKQIFSFVLLTLFALPVLAQDSFFEYGTAAEGFEAAKEDDKVVVLYYFDSESEGSVDYNHIWSDPLVTRFVDKLAVPVSIASGTEAEEALQNLKRKRRRKADPYTPGIYFFSSTGRTLGVLRGDLDGQEGIGQFMLMLGAADYARLENKHDNGRRRFMRYH